MGWLAGWPPLNNLNALHAETVEVFYHCQRVHAEEAQEQNHGATDRHQLTVGNLMVNRILDAQIAEAGPGLVYSRKL